jgi:hypothetical protein
VPGSRSQVACKSVAKATQVRILDPPRVGKSAPDLGRLGQGPILLGPGESGRVRPSTGVHGNIAGTRIMGRLPASLPVDLPSAVDPPSGERAGAGAASVASSRRMRTDDGGPGDGLLGLPGSSVGGRSAPTSRSRRAPARGVLTPGARTFVIVVRRPPPCNTERLVGQGGSVQLTCASRRSPLGLVDEFGCTDGYTSVFHDLGVKCCVLTVRSASDLGESGLR